MVAYKKMKKNNTEHIVYCTICSNPGMNTYELSKKLNMTGGRVRHAISKLKEDKKLLNTIKAKVREAIKNNQMAIVEAEPEKE